MFREDFTSPTGLIRRCLIYSLPQFPSPSIRCWDSPRRASRLLRAWFSKLSACDANLHLSRSILELNTCLAATWSTSDPSVRGQLHNSVSHAKGEGTQNMFLILSENLICREQKKPPEIFRAPQHCNAPLEGRGRGKLSTLLLWFEWTHICVSNKEPFLH